MPNAQEQLSGASVYFTTSDSEVSLFFCFDDILLNAQTHDLAIWNIIDNVYAARLLRVDQAAGQAFFDLGQAKLGWMPIELIQKPKIGERFILQVSRQQRSANYIELSTEIRFFNPNFEAIYLPPQNALLNKVAGFAAPDPANFEGLEGAQKKDLIAKLQKASLTIVKSENGCSIEDYNSALIDFNQKIAKINNGESQLLLSSANQAQLLQSYAAFGTVISAESMGQSAFNQKIEALKIEAHYFDSEHISAAGIGFYTKKLGEHCWVEFYSETKTPDFRVVNEKILNIVCHYLKCNHIFGKFILKTLAQNQSVSEPSYRQILQQNFGAGLLNIEEHGATLEFEVKAGLGLSSKIVYPQNKNSTLYLLALESQLQVYLSQLPQKAVIDINIALPPLKDLEEVQLLLQRTYPQYLYSLLKVDAGYLCNVKSFMPKPEKRMPSLKAAETTKPKPQNKNEFKEIEKFRYEQPAILVLDRALKVD